VTRVADRPDVVVIGAGPAGSTAAQLLAQWGWSVVLLHRDGARPSLAESLPASSRKLFTVLGLISRIDAARFHPNHGNTAHWGGAERTTPTAEAGVHVSRAVFDAVLRRAAIDAGVTLLHGIVKRLEASDPAQVVYADDAGETRLGARLVLDCSGRAGVVARRGWRRAGAPYRTLAIAAEWECSDWPATERTQTLVESYASGWAWSVPLSATRRQCTVMIEQRQPTPGEPLRERYARELANTRGLSARLAHARQIGAPWTCDASIYDCAQAADGAVLLVGDAASFIEPISSAGVKKALLSAWRAAIVAKTMLKDRSRAGLSRDLYNRRERQVYAECSHRAAAFFREASTAYGTPFWTARAGAGTADVDDAFDAAGDWSDDALARSADVRRAFDFLRGSERLRLRTSAGIRLQPVAAIEGHEVVLRDALVVPGVSPAPLRSAAGVDLPALARLARSGGDVPTLMAAYQQHVGPVPIAGLLAGLSLLVAQRALVTEGAPS